jgi:hypothetical protein
VVQDVRIAEGARNEVRSTALPPQQALPNDAIHTGWEWRGEVLVKKWATPNRSAPHTPGVPHVQGGATAGTAGDTVEQAPSLPVMSVLANKDETEAAAATFTGEGGSMPSTSQAQMLVPAPAAVVTAPAPEASGRSTGSQAGTLLPPTGQEEASTVRLRPRALPSCLPREEVKEKLRPHAPRQVAFDVALDVDGVRQAPAAWRQVGRAGKFPGKISRQNFPGCMVRAVVQMLLKSYKGLPWLCYVIHAGANIRRHIMMLPAG